MSASDDDDLLAAELALGLLEDAEASSAEARIQHDVTFAALVEAWRERLAPMLVGNAEQPPEHVWERIQARLAVNDDAPLTNAERALRRWRVFGITASAIAASLALLLVTRTPEAPPAAQPQAEASAPTMVATLQGDDTSDIVTISADEQGRLLVTPVSLKMGSRVPELWIIPEDGKPRSLGVIKAAGASSMRVAPAQMPFVRQGATFAISQEPTGGSPTGSPTGAIVATGKINLI